MPDPDPTWTPAGTVEIDYIDEWTFDYTGDLDSWSTPAQRNGWGLLIEASGRGGRGAVCPDVAPVRQMIVPVDRPAISLFEDSPGFVHPAYGKEWIVQVGGDGSGSSGGWPNGGTGGGGIAPSTDGYGGGGGTGVRPDGFVTPPILEIGGTGGGSGSPGWEYGVTLLHWNGSEFVTDEVPTNPRAVPGGLTIGGVNDGHPLWNEPGDLGFDGDFADFRGIGDSCVWPWDFGGRGFVVWPHIAAPAEGDIDFGNGATGTADFDGLGGAVGGGGGGGDGDSLVLRRRGGAATDSSELGGLRPIFAEPIGGPNGGSDHGWSVGSYPDYVTFRFAWDGGSDGSAGSAGVEPIYVDGETTTNGFVRIRAWYIRMNDAGTHWGYVAAS